MEKNYYIEYYQYERNHWFFKARNKIILDHITGLVGKDQNQLKILNVGVATGYTSVLLKSISTNITSVEYDEECFDFTNQNVPDIGLVQGSILELDFQDNEFDLVCAFDVIEHIEDDKLGLSEMERVCKPDGHVVITVPAFMSIWSHHDVINHHFRRYKKKQLKSLFSDTSKLVFLSYFNFWLFLPVLMFRKINNIFKITEKNNSDSEVGSDLQLFNKDSLGSSILYSVFSSESSLLKKRIKFPFGVSLLASWKK